MTEISHLPNELLRYLFQMLSLKDRNAVVLVDRKWRKVGEDPVLWKECVITINNGEDLSKLSVWRFKYVQIISVVPDFHWSARQLEAFFQATLELPKLKEIDCVDKLDLRCVNSDLLGRALGKLEDLSLVCNLRTTNDQRSAVFNELSKNNCIKDLFLAAVDLKTVRLESLGKVSSGLEKLFLTNISFTSDQVLELFKSISQNNRLNTLRLSFDKVYIEDLYTLSFPILPPVESELFGKAVAKIKKVVFEVREIPPSHLQDLFWEMRQNRGMKSFIAIETNLSAVNPKLMAKGLSKLEKIELATNNLTNEQVRAIFTELKQNSELKFLDLADNNLSSVEPDDLASVVTNMEVVDLSDTQLTTQQITSVLVCAQKKTKLTKLNLSGNRVSEVDPDDLASVVANIEVVDLSETQLTTQQITSVLVCAQQKTKLRKLNLRGNRVSEIDTNILIASIEVIEKLDIDSDSEEDGSADDNGNESELDTDDF